MSGADDTPTPEEQKNGWTTQSLAAYRAERQAAHDLTGGNVVTAYVRPKQQPRILSAKTFNPHTWGR